MKTMPVRIRVTKRDIVKCAEDSYNETSCPIALAIKRVVRPQTRIEVLRDRVTVGSVSFESPYWVNRFVSAFDRNDGNKNLRPRRRTLHLPVINLKRSK